VECATRIITSARKDGLRISISSVEAKVAPEEISPLIETLLPFTQRNSMILALEPDLSTPVWETNLEATIAAIKGTGIALKCRCSGPTGIGPERLSAAIIQACDNKSPVKVTGGLWQYDWLLEPSGWRALASRERRTPSSRYAINAPHKLVVTSYHDWRGSCLRRDLDIIRSSSSRKERSPFFYR
jgi:hypothetical protein